MSSCAATSARLMVNQTCRMRRGSSNTLIVPPKVSSSHQGIGYGLRRSQFHTSDNRSMIQASKVLKDINQPTISSIPQGSLASCTSRTNNGNEDFTTGQTIALSSAILAFTLSLVASQGMATDPTVPTVGTATAKIIRKGGGSGGSGPRGSQKYASAHEGRDKKDRFDGALRPCIVSAGAIQGERWTMEDEYKVADGGRFAAVFDGHGGNGVSTFLRDRLHDSYSTWLSRKHWEENDDIHATAPSLSSHVAALRTAIEQLDKDILEQDKLAHQGSTAVAVVTHVSGDGHRTLVSANVGDSRAILSRNGQAVELTRDHKPNDERERARIMSIGEEVEWDSYTQVHRVRNLSLSRAIGDRFAKPAVSGEPEIRHFPVSDSDEFVLLASDGLWDVMTSQEAVDFVHETLNEGSGNAMLMEEEETATQNMVRRKKIANKVAQEAYNRGSSDNICVVVVWLDDRNTGF